MPPIPKGEEPLNIKKRMDTLFAKLDSAYPDKVISGLEKDHKKWAETVRELYRLLDYPDSESFLNAYGYSVQRAAAGRPKGDSEEIIKELKRRYPSGMPFSKVSEIGEANPDLKATLKTVQNNAPKLYGMSFKDYLTQQGLLGLGDKKSQVDDLIGKLKQRYPENSPLPKNLSALKAKNQDLPLNRLVYIKEIYGMDPKEYLTQQGLIHGETREEISILNEEQYLELLKQRYAGRDALPADVSELSVANPDIPVRRLNKYLREKGEKKAANYYIRNHILQGKDTDTMEFDYCMVSFARTVPDVGEKLFAYLAGENTYTVGDIVVANFGWHGPVLGQVAEVIHCLGIDAPWPVSQTQTLLRKAEPEEQKSSFIPVYDRSPATPAEDWSDGVLAQEERREVGNIPGFVPAQEGQFQCESVADLREGRDTPRGDSWLPCEFRFRGLLLEVAKLKRYAKRNDITITSEQVLSDQIREIRVIADGKTMDLIEQFPALKATGLVEHWWRQQVYVVYSESGFSGITEMEFAGYFDRRHEGGDGRWEWEYDMMEPVHVHFDWLQTGDEETVIYRYPFTSKWKRDFYVREENGIIYIPQVSDPEDFQIESGKLTAYRGPGGDVVIPDSVTEIDCKAQPFTGNPLITSVLIPGSVTNICPDAFAGCKNLRRVILGNGVANIGSSAFSDCTALSEIVFSETLTKIDSFAFRNCSSLDVAGLSFPEKVQFQDFVFSGCKHMPDVLYSADGTRLLLYSGRMESAFVIPDSVAEICDSAFAGHMELQKITLPEDLKRIGEGAFFMCNRLESILLPASLEHIGENAFRSCGSLKEIRIPGNIKTVSDGLLTDCRSLETVILEEGIAQIESHVFDDCRKLKAVQIPISITKKLRRDTLPKSKNLTIYGVPGSQAEAYAKERGLPFAQL